MQTKAKRLLILLLIVPILLVCISPSSLAVGTSSSLSEVAAYLGADKGGLKVGYIHATAKTGQYGQDTMYINQTRIVTDPRLTGTFNFTPTSGGSKSTVDNIPVVVTGSSGGFRPGSYTVYYTPSAQDIAKHVCLVETTASPDDTSKLWYFDAANGSVNKTYYAALSAGTQYTFTTASSIALLYEDVIEVAQANLLSQVNFGAEHATYAESSISTNEIKTTWHCDINGVEYNVAPKFSNSYLYAKPGNMPAGTSYKIYTDYMHFYANSIIGLSSWDYDDEGVAVRVEDKYGNRISASISTGISFFYIKDAGDYRIVFDRVYPDTPYGEFNKSYTSECKIFAIGLKDVYAIPPKDITFSSSPYQIPTNGASTWKMTLPANTDIALTYLFTGMYWTFSTPQYSVTCDLTITAPDGSTTSLSKLRLSTNTASTGNQTYKTTSAGTYTFKWYVTPSHNDIVINGFGIACRPTIPSRTNTQPQEVNIGESTRKVTYNQSAFNLGVTVS